MAPQASRAEAHHHDADAASDDTADVPEWTPAPRRNWVKVFAVAALLVVVGAASWAFFMERPASTPDASTVSATAGSVALRSKAAQHPDAQRTPAGRSPAQAPPTATSQPAETHAGPETQSEETKALDGKPSEPKASEAKDHVQSHAAIHQASADSLGTSVNGLPNIDLNSVTNSVTEKAKQRVDSVGRAITVKPPTFDKAKSPQP